MLFTNRLTVFSRRKRVEVVSLPTLLIVAALFCLISAPNSTAQNYLTGTGEPSFSAPAPVEMGFIENANGSLYLEIPLGSFPQRGLGQDLKVRLVYDSNIWEVATSGASKSWVPLNPGGNWQFVNQINSQLYETNIGSGASNCQTDWNWFDARRASHYFHLIVGSWGTGCASSGSGYALDSSGYKLTVSYFTTPTNYYTQQVYAPDGTLVFNVSTATAPPVPFFIAEDSNGNYLSRDAATGNLIDTLGRMPAKVQTGSCTGTFLTCITTYSISNSTGGASTYTVTSLQIQVKTQFGQTGVSECVSSCSLNVIRDIALPDNSHYTFLYDCDISTGNPACGSPSGQSAYFGTVMNMATPTGGTVAYAYTNFKDAYGNFSRWLNSRTQPSGGLWTYTPSVISTCSPGGVGCKQMVVVNNSFAGSTIFTFVLNNGAWPTVTQYYTGGTLVKTVNTTWDFTNACALIGCTGAAFIRKTGETETLVGSGGANITKQTLFTYDAPQTGNITAVKEWGYRSGSTPTFPTIPDKAQYITYFSTTNNDINRPSKITVCNSSGSDVDCQGAGSKISQTQITFDSYTSGIVSATGMANHDDANFGVGFTARGNPTKASHWVSGSSFLQGQMSYDMTGQVVQDVDPALNVTTYSYADNFYTDSGSGGVGTPPAAYVPGHPTNAYVTSISDVLGTESAGYFFGDGKPAFTKDYNGEKTTHHYLDSMDRDTETDFPIGWTLATYTSANQLDSYLGVGDVSPSASCASCRHMQHQMDSYGRVKSETLVNNPNGTSSPTAPSEIDHSFDSLGRIQAVSHPHAGPADPNNVMESYTYDGLDRTIQITHPDGAHSVVMYGASVAGVTQQGSTSVYGYGYPVERVDESGKQRLEWVDGFNRIIEVDEPSQTVNTPGQGTVTISGSNNGTIVQFQCGQNTWCNRTVYDNGSVTVVVNGFSVSANFSQGVNATAAAVAGTLGGLLNSTASPVTTTVSGSTLTLVSKVPGTQTNYTLSTSSFNGDPTDFPSSVFTGTASGATLTGGSGGIAASPYVTLYSYDAADRLTQVVQGVQTRTFAYDGLGRLTSRTTPESGIETIFYTTSSGSLCAGDSSAVCRKTDARGVTTTFVYDTSSRLTSKSYSDGTSGVTYGYDQGGAPSHAIGRLTRMTDGTGSEAYAYGAMGRITGLTKVIGTNTYTLGYLYNTLGELTQITYPSGHTVAQSYDTVGRLCEVAAQSTACGSALNPYSTGYLYNGADQLLALKFGNNVVGNFAYLPATSKLSAITYGLGTQTYFKLNYFYQRDPTNCSSAPTTDDGEIMCISDSVDSGRTAVFSYDPLNRLVGASTSGSVSFPRWGLSWNYDRYGNRLSQTLTAGSGPQNSMSFNNPGGAQTNRPDGMCFDASGNLLSETVTPCPAPAYSYDGENRLIGYNGTGTTYAYDGNSRRIKKTSASGTTIYVFSGDLEIAEYDNGAVPASPTREFIYSANDLLATLANGQTTYHHKDHLSVRLESDGTLGSPTFGQVISSQGTFPFGESWYSSGVASPDKFIFTTYERDQDSGLDYASARFLDSRLGRFCSADPLMGWQDDPQSWNRYAYVRNDPINVMDPSGKDLFSTLSQVFIEVGLIISSIFDPASIPILYQYTSTEVFDNSISKQLSTFDKAVSKAPDLGQKNQAPVANPQPQNRGAVYCDPLVLSAIQQAMMQATTVNNGFQKESDLQRETGFGVNHGASGGYVAGPIKTGDPGGKLTIPNPSKAVPKSPMIAVFHTHWAGNGLPSTSTNNVAGTADKGDTLTAASANLDNYVMSSHGLSVAPARATEKEVIDKVHWIIQGDDFSSWFKKLKAQCTQ